MLLKTWFKALLAFSLLCTSVYGQQNFTLESMIPPAPNADQMAKYGTYPVGMLTGLPDISFPLYEINTGKLKLPITLSYHASGIKVSQKSTDVGLGWSIAAGGSISRSVFGSPDDGQYGYFNYTPPSINDLWNMKPFQTLQLYTFNPSYDLEPDLFVYNLGNRSGKFICGANKQFSTIPFDPIKIQKSLDGQNKVIFQITDDNGTVYQFNQYSITISESGNNTPITRTTISTWYLTKMISADNSDEIDFEYESNAVEDAVEQHSWPIGGSIDLSKGCPAVINFVNGPLSQSQTTVNYSELLLKKITFRNGSVQFNRNTIREDVFLQSNALDEMVVYNNNQQVIKKVTFNHDYYKSSETATDVQSKRLRLTGFVNSDGNKTLNNVFSFGYEPTPLAKTNSYSQDYWGYYNGQNNLNLIPQATIYASDINSIAFSDGMTYAATTYGPTTNWQIGNANREPSAAFMQAGILNKITYPTGGYTTFEYEPHKYTSQQYVTQLLNPGGRATGINRTTKSENTYTFSYPSQSQSTNLGTVNASLSINFSVTNMNNTIAGDPQVVTLTDVTSNTVQTWKHDGDITVAQSLALIYTLTPGHTYSLDVADYGDNSTYAEAHLSWTENTAQSLIRSGGGLRIKSVKNYDQTSNKVKEDNYVYGIDENGLGTRLFDERHFYKNYQDVVYEAYYQPANGIACVCNPLATQRTYLGLSQYSSLNYLGSPVLYPRVTKYEGTISNNIGKTVYNYNIVTDETTVPEDFVNSGNYGSINNAWNQGELTDETVYKNESGQYNPVSKNSYEYSYFNQTVEYGILAKQYKIIQSQNCTGSFNNSSGIETYGDRAGLGHITMFQYPIKTGASRKTKETTLVYAHQGGSTLQTITTTQYLNPGHLYPGVVTTGLSDGSQKTIKHYYPQDLSTSDPSGMYLKLSQKNMLNIPARTESYLNDQPLESDQLFFNNNFSSNTDQVLPASHTQYDRTNTAVQTLNYSKYDQYGNPLERELNGNIISDLYDYQSAYPVCEVKFAANADIAYTSFEANGSGNWNIGSSVRGTGGITGSSSYQLQNGSITKTGLTNGTTYIVSYWTTNSQAFSITGTQGTPLKGKTINGWTYFEHKVTGVSQVTLPQVTGQIDELRLYPAAAQMTTYTYTPLIGMSSACSPDNTITYYEYDAMGRLQLAKDQYGNVIKAIEYHYQGQ